MYSLGIVGEAFLGIILTLDTWIYSLISSAYKIFMAIASARILSSDAYTAIANKVYIIVGVGMLFVLAYAILKAIIDPDQMSKGEMSGGKILKSVAVAVIGLIVTPLLFELAYMAQGKMLEEDILGKLFFRTSESVVSVDGVGDVNYDQQLHTTGGAVAATSVWQAFFYPADGEDPDKLIADPDIVRLNATLAAVGCVALIAGSIVGGFFSFGGTWVIAAGAIAACLGAGIADNTADKVEDAIDDEISLSDAYAMVSAGESFAIFQAFIEDIDDGKIRYTWFISTVCGAFVAYAFVSYAIDMGLRAAKLAYYQIIAPIPLILNVLPKNGDRLGKFVKAVISTFLEVFVRISVVYIVIYIIAHLNELFSTVGALWDNSDLTNVESLVAMALLVIGLVLFAKQAPKLISDTFGLSAGSGLEGLNIMKKLRDGEVFTAGTVAGSAITSGVQSFSSSFGRKTRIDKNGNEVKRGLGSRVAGGVGAMMVGSAAGAGRAGMGRARSGKPVGSSREMRDNIGRESRAVHDQQQRFQDFNRINDTMEKKYNAVSGIVKGKVKKWATGDVDTGSIDRQAAAFDYMKDMAGKLEGTVGNDGQIKAANRWINDLAQMNANQSLFREITERMSKAGATYASVAKELGFADDSVVRRIHGYADETHVTAADINAARDAADERLKTTKKDAVSRKLVEAHISGVENDTSRMAKQLLASQEFLRYADEFDQLEFDAGVTFGDYLRQSFGDQVTKNGTVNFAKMFSHQSTVGGQNVNFTFKSDAEVNWSDLGITTKTGTVKLSELQRAGNDVTAQFDIASNKINFVDTNTGTVLNSTPFTFDDLKGITPVSGTINLEVASSDTVGGASKKTVFAATKDIGETKGDQFRGSDFYRDRQASKREAEKNKDKK